MNTNEQTIRPSVEVAEPVAAFPHADPAPAGAQPRPRRMRASLSWFIALCSYLPLAAIGYWPVWQHWSQQMNGCNCWDQIQQEWFVQWVPSALQHGDSVLVTNHIYAPAGVNLMWNASVIALGAVFAPLTLTLGVVHTYSILLTLSLALSASTMFLLLRRWTRWLPAAWFGGLVYGFSTLAVEEAGVGRLNLALTALPPLMVLVVVKLVDKEWSPVLGGSVFGLLVTAQLFISEELLVVTALFLGLALVVLAASHSEEVWARRTAVVKAGAAAGITFLVLSIYPLYVQFFGPDRITGPPQSRAQMALFSQDLLSLANPGSTQWVDPAWAHRISGAFSASLASEATAYIGLPLLVVLVTAVVILRRNAVIRTCALVGVVAFWCSMGPRILVDNHRSVLPGPDAVLVHLPLVGDVIPSRFTLGLWFAAAVILALALDAARTHANGVLTGWLERRSPSTGRSATMRRRTIATRGASALVALMGIAVLIPLVPNWPTTQRPANVPSFFTNGQAQEIPAGSLAVTYPYPVTGTAYSQVWQADAGMRYRMLGGYAVGRDLNGAGTFFAQPTTIEYCFLQIWAHRSAPDWLCNRHALAPDLRMLGVTSVIVGARERHAALARSVVDSALGARPRFVGGVWLWRCTKSTGAASCRWR